MSKLITTVDIIRSGQPRPYADSVYEYLVSAEYYWDSTNGLKLSPTYAMSEEEALAALQTLRSSKRWVPKEGKEWYETYLDSIIEGPPGVWTITIVEPYID